MFARFNMSGDFVRGMAVGAAVTYILTNETVQKAIFRGIAGVIGTVQGGLEEVKERYRDAEAEVHGDSEEPVGEPI